MWRKGGAREEGADLKQGASKQGAKSMKAPPSGGGGEQGDDVGGGVHVCVIHCPLPFPGAHWRVVCVPEHPHH